MDVVKIKTRIYPKTVIRFYLQSQYARCKGSIENHAELAKETIKTSSKTKPLELAVREIESEKIQLQICSQLIKSGADVNEKGIDGDTNLCWAIVNDRFDLANQLLDAGADPNQKEMK